MKLVGYRVLISFYIGIDGIWQNTDYKPHWNYKIYYSEKIAEDAIKDMINSKQYSKEEKFKIEPLYIKL